MHNFYQLTPQIISNIANQNDLHASWTSHFLAMKLGFHPVLQIKFAHQSFFICISRSDISRTSGKKQDQMVICSRN
jgi:hypothetical protein